MLKHKLLLLSGAVFLGLAIVLSGCAKSTVAPTTSSSKPATTSAASSAPATSAATSAKPSTAPSPTTSAKPSTAPSPTTSATTAVKAKELKAVFFNPPSGTNNQVFAKNFPDMLSKTTNGALTVKILGGPEVIPAMQLFEAVRSGAVDIGIVPPGYYESEVPEGSAFRLSRLGVAKEWSSGFRDLENKFHEDKGVHLLGRQAFLMPYYVWLKKPFNKPSDLAGLRLGAITSTYYPAVEFFKAVPVAIKTADVYDGLSKGVIDGICQAMPQVVDSAWAEHLKAVVDEPFLEMDTLVIMNLNVWKGLTKDQQAQVTTVMRDQYEPAYGTYAAGLQAEKRKALLEKYKVDFVKLSDTDSKAFLGYIYDKSWEYTKKIVTPERYDQLAKVLK